jgi:hypothetical protein
MRSLIASYYHRRSLRLDNEPKQSKQDAAGKNHRNSFLSATVDNSNSNKQIDDEDTSRREISTNDKTTTLPFDLNIKFIDDADTDASISQSDCEDSNEGSNKPKSTNKIQINSKLVFFLFLVITCFIFDKLAFFIFFIFLFYFYFIYKSAEFIFW